MDGLLVIDKPAGPTSHDVVARARRALGERRIGHTGTLDPAATGVLCLVLGRATRLAQFLSTSDKSYEALVRFGYATDTGDAQGRPVGEPSAIAPTREAIEAALESFRGTYLQQPPAFSAKKINGKRSHKLARARARDARLKPSRSPLPDPPDLPAPATVTVHRLDIVRHEADAVTLSIDCSAGFYVRALAHELGERLGVGAHLASLRRTRSGVFTAEHAIALDTLESDPGQATRKIVPLADVLPALPVFTLSAEGVRRAVNGCALGQRDSATGVSPVPVSASTVRLVSPSGELVGIARLSHGPALLHPSVVLM